MKIYHTKAGVVVAIDGETYLVEAPWDTFVNDDDLGEKILRVTEKMEPDRSAMRHVEESLLVPMQEQELWGSGVTYENSRLGREAESRETGADVHYRRVYDAERPELFFKTTLQRTVPHGGQVRIRNDSTWDVPEPELTLLISSSGKILGYTIGNDMSSRSIEGENPLYLPQAKTFDGCAALGPCVLVGEDSIASDARIRLVIERDGSAVFEGEVGIDSMKRTTRELVGFLYRECTFPNGALLMTGTGIVPSHDFTLQSGDRIDITIDGIGTLSNTVA